MIGHQHRGLLLALLLFFLFEVNSAFPIVAKATKMPPSLNLPLPDSEGYYRLNMDGIYQVALVLRPSGAVARLETTLKIISIMGGVIGCAKVFGWLHSRKWFPRCAWLETVMAEREKAGTIIDNHRQKADVGEQRRPVQEFRLQDMSVPAFVDRNNRRQDRHTD
ncbi:hypothetical protein N7504_010541 [Penicillium tannophilum]|nr:hypothetical protein N7504_010541 [Penicillium tannophilum]